MTPRPAGEGVEGSSAGRARAPWAKSCMVEALGSAGGGGGAVGGVEMQAGGAGRKWRCRRAVQAVALRGWRSGVDREGEWVGVTGGLDSRWVDPGARVEWNLDLKVPKNTS
jgi:hypothetical protein